VMLRPPFERNVVAQEPSHVPQPHGWDIIGRYLDIGSLIEKRGNWKKRGRLDLLKLTVLPSSAKTLDTTRCMVIHAIMPSTGNCRAYAKGFCPWGDTCRFSHNPPSSTGVCRQFARTGNCRFGSQCKFSHDSQPPRTARQGKAKPKRKRPMDKIDEFFSTHPEFDYDSTAPFTQEFYRMCDFFDWDRDDPDRQNAREEFRTAMVQEFNSIYGGDVDDLSSWQVLCEIVRISPVPDDIQACREVKVTSSPRIKKKKTT
jgi:Zinc finger C-x8-C-x5-C-x3-H type (and similar)